MKSLLYALAGLAYAFKSQVNMRIHIFTALVIVALSIVMHLNLMEWCVIMLCIGSVITAELLNTSMEIQADITSPERNPKTGHVKDVAAAAVLVVCIVSAIIGMIIFIPKIIQRFSI